MQIEGPLRLIAKDRRLIFSATVGFLALNAPVPQRLEN